MVADQRKRRRKALQQRTIDFVDGLVQKICSHNENYKYFLTAIKEDANLIMEQVSSFHVLLLMVTRTKIYLIVANCKTGISIVEKILI